MVRRRQGRRRHLVHGSVRPVLPGPAPLPLHRLRRARHGRRRPRPGHARTPHGAAAVLHHGGWRRRGVHGVERRHLGAADGLEDGGGAHAHVGHGADDGVVHAAGQRRCLANLLPGVGEHPVVVLLLLLLGGVELRQVGRCDEVIFAIHAYGTVDPPSTAWLKLSFRNKLVLAP